MKAVGKTSCWKVTDEDLCSVKSLDFFFERVITDLKENDFSGLSSLERIDLSGNGLEIIPKIRRGAVEVILGPPSLVFDFKC